MASREERILNLAATLKASGLAKSEVQARMMAEEMVGVEENVQKRYDEEHTRAHEYLNTAKNLGNPRVKESSPVEKRPIEEIRPVQNNNRIKPLDLSIHEKSVNLEEVHSDINMGSGTLKDLMLNQIKADNHEIKNIEELKPVDDSRVEESFKVDDLSKSSDVQISDDVKDSKDDTVDVSKDFSSEDASEVDSPKLDGDKLREMMEEDGPLEEHTREIKGKPDVIKPKEEYVENNVDLSNMFNFNKK
ncbi:MAG: hypothetical protein ACP5NV_05505 [Candidatus Woesearchaeota archaeon]